MKPGGETEGSGTMVVSPEKTKGMGLVLAHINVRSLYGSYEDYHIQPQIENSIYDVVTVSETFLNEGITNNNIALEGYNILRQDRACRDGGGLLAYIKQDLTFSDSELKHLNCNTDDLEAQFFSITKSKMRRIVIVNIYRRPQGKLPEALKVLNDNIKLLDKGKYKEIFVMGDINVDWFKDTPDRDKVKGFAKGNGFKQYIKDITRFNLKGEHTCIDHIYTNSDKIVESGTKTWNLSDHELIYCIRKHISEHKIPISFTGRTYKDYIRDNYTTGLKNTNWERFWACTSPGDAWQILEDN